MENLNTNKAELATTLKDIKLYFESFAFTVFTDERKAHPNAPDYLMELKFGNFKCIQQFYLPELMQIVGAGQLNKELQKRKTMVDYWVGSAGYKYENGCKPHSFCK